MFFGCLYELAAPILLISGANPDRRGKSLLLLLFSALLRGNSAVLLVLLEANRALLLKTAVPEHDVALDTKLALILLFFLLFQCFAHLCSSLSDKCFLDIVYKSDAHF